MIAVTRGVAAGGLLNSGSNNIDIGYFVAGGSPNEANTIRIGNGDHNATFIAGISGASKLGTMTSSARFKDEIKPMDKASAAILALKPVTFRYKKAIDPQGIPQFGLVAEDVEKVSPDLVVRDKEGKPYSVRYDQVNAMLLNEFLKEHKIVQEQGAMIASQQKQIDALSAGLQKVTAQLELNRSAPQTVLNDR
ncbi:MAG: hypothetical protein DMF31_05375 [Verrucomicrobia bacterium]|nr:MAG: hypothetical protein DMF31_05375 [Verrucomicrobiota bacterium]